jgi:hypothetical protein
MVYRRCTPIKCSLLIVIDENVIIACHAFYNGRLRGVAQPKLQPKLRPRNIPFSPDPLIDLLGGNITLSMFRAFLVMTWPDILDSHGIPV